MLFDLEVTLPKSYRISKLAVKMSIFIPYLTTEVETDLMSNGEGLNKLIRIYPLLLSAIIQGKDV